MITGIWMDEDDGANRLLVQLDEDDLVVVDFRCDPVLSEDVTDMDLRGWVSMGPTEDGAS